jgi:hypothetical protein
MRFAGLAFCFAGCVFGQPAIPGYEVHRASSPITVDGKGDDKAWAAAGKIELIFPWDSQTGAKQKTTVRLLWDDANLYALYECEDADIVAFRTERDDPTYLDDAVELFINPMPSQTEVYYGMEMNARAVLYDYVMLPSKGLFKQFNMQGVQLATFIDGTLNVRGNTDKGWSLEVAIPWSNFDGLSPKPPSVGSVWAANLNRWDGVEPNRRMSNWSNPMKPTPNPHAPERFGKLIFVK